MEVGGQRRNPDRFTTGKDPVPKVLPGAENLATHRDMIPGPYSP
jgi:hypothetical protein